MTPGNRWDRANEIAVGVSLDDHVEFSSHGTSKPSLGCRSSTTSNRALQRLRQGAPRTGVGISDAKVRTIVIQGARDVLAAAIRKRNAHDPLGTLRAWAVDLADHRVFNKAAVELAL
jgi:hypothetical protein